MATKAELEKQLAELQAQTGATEKDAKPKGKKVAIPAWAASSASEVIGIDTTTGNSQSESLPALTPTDE